MTNKDLIRHSLGILIILIAGIIAYSNTFDVSFHYDDIPNIVENARIRHLSGFFPPTGPRDVGFLSYSLNYYFGGLHVAGYHLINLLIHLLNACILYALLIHIFHTPFMRSLRDCADIRFIALSTALLFVLHPLQTQAVTYIVQRFSSLAALFYLLSLLCYMKFRVEDGKVRSFVYYGMSILSTVLAMRTKEIAFTAPVSIFLVELFFFKGTMKKRIAGVIPFFLTMAIIPAGLMGRVDFSLDTVKALAERTTVTEEGVSLPRGVYVFTQFRVIVTYIRLMFFPVDQALEYDYPNYASLAEYPVSISLIVLLFLVGTGGYLFYRSASDESLDRSSRALLRVVSFGIFFFFVAVSVESFIVSITHVIFEHRMYLPSIGILTAVVPLVLSIAGKGKYGKTAAYALVFALSLTLGLSTYARNAVWRSEITLWEDGVKKAPMRAAPHYHLGVAYLKEGRAKEALKELQLASLIGPDYPSIYFMTGRAYESLGWMSDAEKAYRKAIDLKKNYLTAHDRLGALYYRKGDLEEALKEYMNILSFEPDNDTALRNRDMILKMMDGVKADFPVRQ